MLLVHIAGNWTIRSLASQQPRVTAADRAGLRLPEPTPARNTARGLSTLADLIPPLTPGLFVLFWSLSTMRTRLSFPWNNSYLCTTSSERRESRLRSSVRVSLECLEEKTLLSTGLVAAYNFDAGSGTVLTDVSGNGNNGTITNATWSTAGKYGGALSFNGKSSTVTINNSPSLDLTTGMTLEAWVNPTTVSSAWRDVIYKGNDNYFLEATSTNNKLPGAGGTFGGADVATYGTSALATKTWTFLTETYDGATLRLYVNGVQVSSMAQTGNILTSTNALQIGGDSIYGQYFNGLIDNVRIYNTALTQSQIQTDMNTPVTSSAPAASAVTGETPGSGATGVATSTGVTATFNEAVQASSITSSDFVLKSSSGSTVTAVVSYNSTTDTATLTPSALLANSTAYTATINNVLSSSGVAMTGPFNWSFTTGPAPAVTSETPNSGATGVATSTALTATFNEAVQAATITSSNLVLKSSSGATVPATVSYNSSTNTATLTPSALLANSTIYTATVSGVEDTAGDPIAAPFSWSFTTGPAPSNSTGDPTTLAPSLGPPPSPGPNVIWVSTQSALQSAFTSLQSGQTIVIEPGTYNLSSTLYIGLNSNITNVTVRGSTDNFNDVTLLGNGMDNSSYGNVPMGISIWNAQHVTIADLSIGDVYYDPIEVRGNSGASAVTIYHVHLFDAGEQFIKVDPPSGGVGASNSAVEYSMIDYTNGPPVTDHGGGIGYTNGIDIHDGSNWLIAHNLIENLHTPDSDPAANLWNPAILIWNHSSNVTVDGNTIINCDRAIAFGLIDQTSGYDNQGGIIRNNFIYQAPGLFSSSRAAASDGQIIVWDSPNSQVLFNSILTDGNSTNSIQLRWTTTGAVVDGNLADASIRVRDGATYSATGNYLSATPSMFTNPSTGDLHLVVNSATLANVIDQATAEANDPNDWNGNSRTVGGPTDIGADGSQSSTKIVPTVTSESPSLNSTGVANTTALTATFNESVVASSITTTSFVLKDSNNNTVTATVSYTDSNHTATLTPSSPLSASTEYTATISGVTDAAGNVMAAPFSWSFTTSATAATATDTIWSNAATPAVASFSDPNADELGVKFESAVAGYITGIRFYKGSSNTGTHVGHLWTSTGTLLASATFTNETATGWQQVTFANPVAITANTVYVASYYAPNGGYAANGAYFASSGVTSGPLTALSNAAAGGNGVYAYGGGFPASTYNATNYWVDVVFNPGTVNTPPPTVTAPAPAPTGPAPAVTTCSPASNAT